MMPASTNVAMVREAFRHLLLSGDFAEDGNIEIVNACFVADEPAIFGTPNHDYIDRELDWYESMSLNVNDITPPIPEIWKSIASVDGQINSNYGWCIWSDENYYQFDSAIRTLTKNPASRQATMIYIRPTMHDDATAGGMKDFMCTYAVQLLIRNGKLDYLVYMRSNDAVFGYKNDYAWHAYIHKMARDAMSFHGLKLGKIYWNAASLHVYPRHFHLVTP